jgi:hypothetical protein
LGEKLGREREERREKRKDNAEAQSTQRRAEKKERIPRYARNDIPFFLSTFTWTIAFLAFSIAIERIGVARPCGPSG